MKTYITVQGDMWDSIAYKELGSEKYADRLIRANVQHRDVYIFSAGTELIIPDIDTTVSDEDLPPWKKVSG